MAIPVILLSLGLSHSISPSGLDDDVFRYTNKLRRAHGMPALVMREELNKLAYKHSEDMAKGRCKFGHAGFEKREKEAARKMNCRSVAENVAYGASTGKEVVAMWEGSRGHRLNMLGDYNYVGIGTARDRQGTIYYTQIFAR